MAQSARIAGLALAAAFGLGALTAQAATVTFTQLSGVTGGTIANTAVFRADLSGLGLGSIASLTIQDNSALTAGSPGQFSGFDLDAIVISTVLITDAADVGLLVPAAVFNVATSILIPGSQQPPTDPALFGTSGGQVDDSVATLGTFDGESTTLIPGADGFVSLGFGGGLALNLVMPIPVSSPLYLYIGEVGNNGEVADGSVTISSTPVQVPEPVSLALFGLGLAGLGVAMRRRA